MQTNYAIGNVLSETLRFTGRATARARGRQARPVQTLALVAACRGLGRARAWEQVAWLTLIASALAALVVSAI